MDAYNNQNLSDCLEYEWGGGGSASCTKDMNYPVSGGTDIGTVGYKQGIFDLGMEDGRVDNYFINISRWPGGENHYVCPYDYFDNTTKDLLYSRIWRTTEPRCGNISQDVLGTLQGIWFYDNDTVQGGEQTRELGLAFAEDHWEPPETIISIGEKINHDPILWVVDFNESTPY